MGDTTSIVLPVRLVLIARETRLGTRAITADPIIQRQGIERFLRPGRIRYATMELLQKVKASGQGGQDQPGKNGDTQLLAPRLPSARLPPSFQHENRFTSGIHGARVSRRVLQNGRGSGVPTTSTGPRHPAKLPTSRRCHDMVGHCAGRGASRR